MSNSLAQPERDTSLMCMGRLDALALFIFYMLILCYSIYYLIPAISEGSTSPINSELDGVYVLVFSSFCGSTIFYSRKLYKAGINYEYNFHPDGFTIERISTIAFFILRIPSSAIFSIILYAIWRLTISVSGENSFQFTTSLKYLLISMGFFSGFSAGRIIAYFEKDGFSLARNGGRVDG
ncbi:hypothetical protein [Xanthobacter tagetidis]|uniref:hypothetical protein n=1 Tax=Xanthobacter tagetidis TaxID=60216 RepID=UPI0011C3DA99|nr:hypothetical protein [Xanthobacter tagetidis]MBB6307331.1 hypothetical protein [Xanthobacter tagetidis]